MKADFCNTTPMEFANSAVAILCSAVFSANCLSRKFQPRGSENWGSCARINRRGITFC